MSEVEDTLVVLVERARHRRELRLREGDRRRRRNPHQFSGIVDHRRLRRRLVVGEVDDPGCPLFHSRGNGLGDIVDMDTVEQVARLDDAPRRAFLKIDERIPTGPIDAGDPENRGGEPPFSGEGGPAALSLDPRDSAAPGRMRRRPLANPGAAIVSIDADGREIADPAQLLRAPAMSARWWASTGSAPSPGGIETIRCVASASAPATSGDGSLPSKTKARKPSAPSAAAFSGERAVAAIHSASSLRRRAKTPAL